MKNTAIIITWDDWGFRETEALPCTCPAFLEVPFAEFAFSQHALPDCHTCKPLRVREQFLAEPFADRRAFAELLPNLFDMAAHFEIRESRDGSLFVSTARSSHGVL